MLTTGCAPGKRAIAPEMRSKLNEEPEIIAFRYNMPAVLFQEVASGFHNPPPKEITVKQEPLIPLMENFLAAVTAELKLDNIRALPEPRRHHPNYRWHLDRGPERTYDLIQIQRTFQTGLVFDFDRHLTVFDNDFWALRIWAKYHVHLWAKARLIRVSDQKILWQGVCDIGDGDFTLNDFQQPITPLIQETLDRAIETCGQEWFAQFMGKK
jgi:hypothetical protein